MRTWFAAVGIAVSLFAPAQLRAQDAMQRSSAQDSLKLDDYCERVREAGKSTAVVLLGPRVSAQVIKFPAGGDLGLGQTTVSETQFRGSIQYSVTDAYRGLLALRLGDAECKRQRLAQPLEDAIRLATDQGRREALSRELRSLREKDAAVAGLERDSEARRHAQVGTVVELIEIHSLASAFRAQEAETEDALGHLDALALAEPSRPLSGQAIEYQQASMDMERLGSETRQVLPWGFSVSGGLAANGAVPVDWFGTVELSYNLGGLAQGGVERRLLSARARELASANYELASAARAVDAALRRSVEVLKQQIAVVENELRGLREEESLLEQSEASGRLHMASVVKLRLFVLEAQLVYLKALGEQRRAWESPQ